MKKESRRTGKKLGLLAVAVAVSCAFLAIGAGQLGDSAQPAPCTVTVAAGESIQAVIDAVADGGVVCLEAGIYEESLVIRKSLTLRGSGPDPASTRIIPPSTWSFEEKGISLVCVGEWGDSTRIEVHIENLSVGGETGWANRAVEAMGRAALFMSNCRIGPSSGTGIQLSGSATALVERTSVIENQGYAGFNAWGTSSGLIRECEIVRNSEGNLEVEGSAQIVVSSTLIEGPGGHHGILIAGEASVTAEDCVIRDNHFQGVEVVENGTVSISNCDITKNRLNGIALWNSTQATVLDSRVTDNRQAGIAVHDSASAVLEGNEVNRNDGWGVFHEGGAASSRLRVTGCGNDIEDDRGASKNRFGDVYPDSLGGLLRRCGSG